MSEIDVLDESTDMATFVNGESFSAPAPLSAEIFLKRDGDIWCLGINAVLPDGEFVRAMGPHGAMTSRAGALELACETLIAWCGEQKDQGSKKHKAQAEKLQIWALNIEHATDETTGTADDAIPAAIVEAAREQTEAGFPLLHTDANADGRVHLIPIQQLYESPWNPRQYYPEVEMQELVESMKASGFREWLPLMVRPVGEVSEVWTHALDRSPAYEIGAGHRRRRAAEAAGIKLIPCVVRAMTDAEFLDVLNFDNTGREDVHPLHEAGGWREWMKRTGKGVLDIAARIGQSKEYVYQRLKYSDLIPEARAAFLDGKITGGHAILIARLQEADQKKALKFCQPGYSGAIPTVRQLNEVIRNQFYKSLHGAPFNQEDRALLAGAGSCIECPKRSGNAPDFTPESGESDLCTDVKCYGQKVDNHLFRIREDMRVKNPPAKDSGLAAGTVLNVSMEYSTRKKGVYNRLEWEEVKKGDKGAVAAVIVEGEGIGRTLYVRLKPRAPGASGVGSTMAPKVTQEDREREAAEREKRVNRELDVRRAILTAIKSRVGGLSRGDIEALLVKHFNGFDVEAESICELHGIDYQGHTDALQRALPKMKESELYAVVIEAACAEDLSPYHAESEPEGLLAAAKRYKVDAVKIRATLEEQAKEAEGGKRKEIIKKLPTLGEPKKAGKDTDDLLGRRAESTDDRVSSTAKTRPGKKPAPAKAAPKKPAAKVAKKSAPAKKGGKK